MFIIIILKQKHVSYILYPNKRNIKKKKKYKIKQKRVTKYIIPSFAILIDPSIKKKWSPNSCIKIKQLESCSKSKLLIEKKERKMDNKVLFFLNVNDLL